MIYSYICDHCGYECERQVPMSQWDKAIICVKCTKSMRRDFIAEQAGVKDTPGTWPMASDAAGVHPDQVAEAMAFDRRHGVPTDYNADGNPLYTSREHRARHCRANGLYDRNAGYGDATPKQNMRPDKRAERVKREMAERR